LFNLDDAIHSYSKRIIKSNPNNTKLWIKWREMAKDNYKRYIKCKKEADKCKARMFEQADNYDSASDQSVKELMAEIQE